MKLRKLLPAGCLFALASLPAISMGQEGYPLDGTWRGEGGQPPETVVVVMSWDGATINGRINPGRNTINFTSAKLDAANWQLHAEAMSKEGEVIVIDAKLENIGSYTRTLTGTWTVDGVANPIVLTRE
ncbi:MAG: hypothetical protein V4603_02410 [Pseudomonadota bacterium]